MKKGKDNQPSLKKNFILSTAYQILCIITPIITAPYVSRVLRPDGMGIYSYTGSYVTYFSLFAALGTASYGLREIARNRKDKSRYSLIFWEIELLTVITTSFCILLWGAWILLNTKYRLYYIILTLSLIAVIFDISWFYMGMERFQNTIYVNAIFKIVGVVSIFLLVKQKSDLYMYILIMSLTTLLGNISMWIKLPEFIVKIDKKDIRIKKHFKETFIYFVPTIATSIYTILDKILIGIITKNEYENGYYEQATKIINMAKMVTFTAINRVMEARISFLFAEEKYDEIKNKIEKSVDYILFMGIGIMFGLIGISGRFVPCFFGDGYEKTIYLLMIMSPIILIIGISNCLGAQYYSPAGYRSTSAKFLIIGSLVNLVLNICMIPLWKSYGATVASIVAELTITVLYLKNCDGFLTLKYIIKESSKKIIAGLLMLICIFVINNFINDNFVALFVEAVSGLLVYVAVLFLLNDKFLKSALSSLFKK